MLKLSKKIAQAEREGSAQDVQKCYETVLFDVLEKLNLLKLSQSVSQHTTSGAVSKSRPIDGEEILKL